MRLFTKRTGVWLGAAAVVGLLPVVAHADTATSADTVEVLPLDAAATPLDASDSTTVSDPIAIPLPTAYQSGMLVLGGAAAWRGAKRLYSRA